MSPKGHSRPARAGIAAVGLSMLVLLAVGPSWRTHGAGTAPSGSIPSTAGDGLTLRVSEAGTVASPAAAERDRSRPSSRFGTPWSSANFAAAADAAFSNARRKVTSEPLNHRLALTFSSSDPRGPPQDLQA